MIRALGLVLLAVWAALAGAVTSSMTSAIAVGVLIGAAVAFLDYLANSSRKGRLASQVNNWVGKTEVDLLPTDEETRADRELAVALNALAAAYARRGRRLEERSAERSRFLDAVADAAALFSSENRLIACNEPARELLGEVELGQTVVQSTGAPALHTAIDRARADDAPIRLEAQAGGRDVRVRVTPVGDEVLVVLHDLTNDRRVAELRRDFVANASHELKTPATALQALSEALEVTLHRDPDRAAQLTEQLREASERLVRLVHDLLDLSRLEDPSPYDLRPVDLVELTAEEMAALDERARDLEIDLSLEAPARARLAAVEGDIRLIVGNLVANAIQYNRPKGSVDVTIEPCAEGWKLVVQDDGLGIPQQDLGRIFERFYRVDAARSRDTGGTGLGLSIVRHAVERHRGRIEVSSLLGVGTTFTVVLPVG